MFTNCIIPFLKTSSNFNFEWCGTDASSAATKQTEHISAFQQVNMRATTTTTTNINFNSNAEQSNWRTVPEVLYGNQLTYRAAQVWPILDTLLTRMSLERTRWARVRCKNRMWYSKRQNMPSQSSSSSGGGVLAWLWRKKNRVVSGFVSLSHHHHQPVCNSSRATESNFNNIMRAAHS